MKQSDRKNVRYAKELPLLQIELLKLQEWIRSRKKRLLILFEGRDAAGKGGAIFRFTRHLNPKEIRVVALPKPNGVEKGQWYFQRYIEQLPNRGEMVFFDRSWYNRAIVEPVMGFCTNDQYKTFMKQVPVFEKLITDDGIDIIKFWFSIDINIQRKRLNSRKTDPLRNWKLSTVDTKAQQVWDDYTKHKEAMFRLTHKTNCRWVIINGNHKPAARLESIRYVLSRFDYDGKGTDGLSLESDRDIVNVYPG